MQGFYKKKSKLIPKKIIKKKKPNIQVLLSFFTILTLFICFVPFKFKILWKKNTPNCKQWVEHLMNRQQLITLLSFIHVIPSSQHKRFSEMDFESTSFVRFAKSI